MNFALSAATFSTDGYAPRRRAGAWRQHMAIIYDGLEVAPRAEWSAGRISRTAIGCVEVAAVSTDAQRVVRRRRDPAAGEDFVLVFPRGNALDVQQGWHPETIAPGDAFVLNTARRYEASGPNGSGYLTLKLPAHLLRSRLGRLDDRCGRGGQVDPDLAGVVARFVADLLVSPPAVLDHPRLEQVCLDLATVMLDTRGRGGGRQSADLPALMLADLRSHIERHLGDPDLSIHAASSACRVSVRIAQKVLQQSGTTFGHELMLARLRRADALLNAGGSLSIGEIAYACGFVSQSHFAARYRRWSGSSPRDARAAARCRAPCRA